MSFLKKFDGDNVNAVYLLPDFYFPHLLCPFIHPGLCPFIHPARGFIVFKDYLSYLLTFPLLQDIHLRGFSDHFTLNFDQFMHLPFLSTRLNSVP